MPEYPEYPDNPPAWLHFMNLKQSPPRVRSVFGRGHWEHRGENCSGDIFKEEILQLKFPWVSIGGLWSPIAPRNRAMVFLHDRAWKDFEDAASIIRPLPLGFNSATCGYVCTGETIERETSPEEAFWMTSFPQLGYYRNRTVLDVGSMRPDPGPFSAETVAHQLNSWAFSFIEPWEKTS